MKKYGIESIRNVGLFGHQGSGKSSLAEAMLFTAGAIDRLGHTDEGNSTTDFDPEEVKRRISINLAVAPCEWGANKINVIDCPGYLDFRGEVQMAMRVVEAAILVTPAQGDVEVGFEIAWEIADAVDHPRAIFVNKLDRENANYYAVLENLRSRYGNCIAPVQIPLGEGEDFSGVVDLIHMRAYTGQGRAFHEVLIPEELVSVAQEYREKLIESAAEGSDDLMERFFADGTLTDEDVVRGLHEGIDRGRVVPVMCGSAMQNMGAATLMNLISEAFPNPAEMGPAVGVSPEGIEIERKVDDSEPMSALVFKSMADPFVGQLTYFKVMSGTLKSDTHVWNSVSKRDERIGQLYYVKGKFQEATTEVHSGDIAAVAKLAATHTGDTLCDAQKQIVLSVPEAPQPVFEVAIIAKSKVDEDKMGPALQRVGSEDPSFTHRRDPVTFQTVICGMGDTHISIAMEKLRKFGAHVDVTPMKVPYKETIKSKAEAQGKHKKQSGGRGQYGDCWLRIEPLSPGEGFKFIDAIVGGSVPRQYIPAVEKGICEALPHGTLSGNPIVDIKCTVYDGSYHDVDSSEAAFKMAAVLALHTGIAKADPVILEPMVKAMITVPESMMGDIMSDISSKRGRIVGTEPAGHKKVCVNAMAPMSEMLRYAIELRSISHGRGSFSLEPSHYEEVPAHLSQGIIAEHQNHRSEVHH